MLLLTFLRLVAATVDNELLGAEVADKFSDLLWWTTAALPASDVIRSKTDGDDEEEDMDEVDDEDEEEEDDDEDADDE